MDKHQQFMSDILTASTVVHNQLIRLNMLDKKFTLMDKDLRHKIAANIKVGNNATARALAIELSNIHSDISRTVPTASHLLSQMTSMTSDVLHNSNITSEMGKISNSNSIDADALSILNEVEGILEHETKSRLP